MEHPNSIRVKAVTAHSRRVIDALGRAMDRLGAYDGNEVDQDYICGQLGYANDQLLWAFRQWALAHGRRIPSAVVGVFEDGTIDIDRRRHV